MIQEIDGVESIFVLGGSSPTGDRDIRRASVTVILRQAGPFAGAQACRASRRSLPVVGPMLPETAEHGPHSARRT